MVPPFWYDAEPKFPETKTPVLFGLRLVEANRVVRDMG
jgi:hypothetical protein